MSPTSFQLSGQFHLTHSSGLITSTTAIHLVSAPSYTSHYSSLIFISDLQHFYNFLLISLPMVSHVPNLTSRYPPGLSSKEFESPAHICKSYQGLSIILWGKNNNNSSSPWYKTSCNLPSC